jgi:hypothetical protein
MVENLRENLLFGKVPSVAGELSKRLLATIAEGWDEIGPTPGRSFSGGVFPIVAANDPQERADSFAFWERRSWS